jgi:two-component system phosphate regulon response regulator OmpR
LDIAPHILVVDDDSRIRTLLKRYLGDNGFRVTVAADAAEARERLRMFEFDLLVLDRMMPGESGLELTAALRQEGVVPILMLTAMAEADDRISGLESGADDYLVKPFEPRELVLRIKTILRRANAPAPATVDAQLTDGVGDQIRFGDHVFDLNNDLLMQDGEPVRLTESEIALLRAFAETPGRTLSREELVARNAVRGSVRTVDVQITRLRRKIEADPKFPRYLQTVRGKGYMLRGDL